MQDKKRFKQGSITIEACISFPVFLTLFFIFLFFIKLIAVDMVLGNAAVQTAKQVAASAYPIVYLCDSQDKILNELDMEQILDKLMYNSEKGIPKGVIDLFSFDTDHKNNQGLEMINNTFKDVLDSASHFFIKKILKAYIDEDIVKSDRVQLVYAKLPRSKIGGDDEPQKSSSEQCGINLIEGRDYDADDAVVQLAYDYSFQLPFIGLRKLTLVHTAIEKGWINGSNGVVAANQEGLELEEAVAYTVYVTRTGVKFHRDDCRHLRLSKISIEQSEAESKGYTPCKVCKPVKDGYD